MWLCLSAVSHKETLLSEQQTGNLIGTILADRFRIDRLIGTGGMATVYEAMDIALGRTVAVKLFRTDTADDSGPARESGEIAVLASLNHFALVTLFDAGTAEIQGTPRSFFVMEFIDGSDLRSRISQGPLRPAEVAEMGADLAEALHYVHSKGIIHRDLKPGNVLIAPSEFPGRTGHAKLADFGIARLFDGAHLTATGALLGTANYLSPEQALGAALGPPSDVYSLGLVLLECLTGQREFPGSAVESAVARLQRQPHIPAALGPEWVTLLTGMTARESADRLTALDAAVRMRGLFASDTGDTATMLLSTDEAAIMRSSTDAAATAALGVADAADDASTMLMPAAAAGPVVDYAGSGPTAATTVLGIQPTATGQAPTAPSASRRAARERPRLPRRAVLTIVAAVLVLIAVLVLVFTLRPSGPTATPPSYPPVKGTLGTHLQELQKSVEP